MLQERGGAGRGGLDGDEGTPVSQGHEADARVRELSRKVALLQEEVAELRARHLRHDELDSGLGSLLTEREATFSDVERLANVGSWVWDVRTNEVAWSEQAFRIFGYDPTRDGATREKFMRALHPDDRALLEGHSARTVATGITSPAPRCRFIHADGSMRHVLLTATPIRDQAGTLIRIVGAALDVTEFVAVESELRRTAQHLNEAERMAGLGSWNWSAETDHIEWSETMYRIFGVEPGTKITSELFFERLHPDDRARVRDSDRCAARGPSSPIEFRVVWPNGSVRHVCMQASTEGGPEGRVTRMNGTVQDITARTQLEQQLRQSQKMDAIGTFAGGIAHDFNNYLMVIQGNVHRLKTDCPEGSRERGILNDVSTAASSCAALTRQLLSLARRQISEPRLLDVAALVAKSASLMRRVLGDHIELVLVAPNESVVVRADPSQLEQMVVNLAVNARDAMPEGGTVTIETSRCRIGDDFASAYPALNPGEYVCLSVKDIGAGIPAEIQSRVFEPFFTTKAQGKGTGLGLSTVYGIAKQWHGHVAFESQLGRGTEFRVWLPAHAGPAEPITESEPPAATTGQGTVLLAEDEPQVRRLISAVLEQAGYAVLVAEDGRQALRLAEQNARVDLLISDVRMPQLGGVELARRLRSTWPKLRVLLMSGYPDIDAVHGQESGDGDALLAKPFDAHVLLDRVRHALDG